MLGPAKQTMRCVLALLEGLVLLGLTAKVSSHVNSRGTFPSQALNHRRLEEPRKHMDGKVKQVAAVKQDGSACCRSVGCLGQIVKWEDAGTQALHRAEAVIIGCITP